MNKSLKKKKAEEKRQQETACIKAYLQELVENINLKLICDMEAEELLQENLLWTEEITIESIVYRERKQCFLKRFFSALFRIFHRAKIKDEPEKGRILWE